MYRTVPGPATPCTETEGPLYRDRQVHRYSQSVEPCSEARLARVVGPSPFLLLECMYKQTRALLVYAQAQ